jgi:hypothetical protein
VAGIPGESGYQDGIGNNAKFSIPMALAIDSSGNIFVSDSGNKVIRKITNKGLVSTLAGAAEGNE